MTACLLVVLSVMRCVLYMRTVTAGMIMTMLGCMPAAHTAHGAAGLRAHDMTTMTVCQLKDKSGDTYCHCLKRHDSMWNTEIVRV